MESAGARGPSGSFDLGITVVAAAATAATTSAGPPALGRDFVRRQRAVGLTVGASSTEGTLTRADDKVAEISVRAVRHSSIARPSPIWSRPASARCRTISTEASPLFHQLEIWWRRPRGYCGRSPYMVSQWHQHGAPVVRRHRRADAAGESDLTPNLIKAILQYRRDLSRLRPARRGSPAS